MKKNRTSTTVLLILVFLAGLSLLLYPSISNYWNSLHQSKAIADYSEKIAEMDREQYGQIIRNAEEYNRKVPLRDNVFALNEEERADYESQLNPVDTGIMGYVEIPSIACVLPIYHGTGDSVLQVAVGHLDWTSLPVGGETSHCVLSGHRGLPSAKLFTNLDKLAEGDIFMICVLDEVYTYEVDQVLIVEPHDVENLQLVPGEDLCTLVTCTPYGVNTHRLLVRGHRVETTEAAATVYAVANAIQIEPSVVAPILAIPMLLALGLWVLIRYRKRK